MRLSSKTQIWAIVLVASLGYFVDIYDLILFSVVRIQSLKDLGLSGEDLTNKGLMLLNLQMAGMLIGGVIFGVLGDRRGRLSVLFGSIFLYSIANFLNGFVHDVNTYAILRFIAGIGLAGELGAGITLVTEVLPKDKRGYGTTIVATVGVSGAVLAWVVTDIFDWRMAYFIGGGLGLALLALRIGVAESGLFKQMKESTVKRGDFLSLFTNKDRLKKFLACIFMGIQLWYVVGILISLAPEFAAQLMVSAPILAGKAVMFCYVGLIFGDFASGILSQILKSRKKVAALFLTLSAIGIISYFYITGVSETFFYGYCFYLGFASGYWAIFVTVAAEQFGTNLRATVATTVPNFVRGSLVPISIIFGVAKTQIGLLHAGLFVGVLCIVISYWGLSQLKECFSADLNYLEK